MYTVLIVACVVLLVFRGSYPGPCGFSWFSSAHRLSWGPSEASLSRGFVREDFTWKVSLAYKGGGEGSAAQGTTTAPRLKNSPEGLTELRKDVVTTATGCYHERIWIKMSQGKRQQGQGPGESRQGSGKVTQAALHLPAMAATHAWGLPAREAHRALGSRVLTGDWSCRHG